MEGDGCWASALVLLVNTPPEAAQRGFLRTYNLTVRANEGGLLGASTAGGYSCN